MLRTMQTMMAGAGLTLSMLTLSMLALPAHAQTAWPERPVSIIVPAGAGGGTDQTARMLAERLHDRFGTPFNVVNQGQGGGVVGINSIMTAKPDGYTIGVIYNFAHYKPMGQGDFDAANLAPIAQYNFDPAGFHVRSSSEWASLPDALDAIKANPGAYSIACGGGCGGSWPIAIATLFSKTGVDLSEVRMIPGQGAAAALQDMVAGGFDVVPSSVPEAGALIEAGYVRALAVFGNERLAAFPDVPTVSEQIGQDLNLGAWRGLVGPAGLSDDIVNQLEEAMREIVESEDWRQQMTARGFGIQWRNTTDFGDFIANEEIGVRQVVKDLGL